jgi:hypothetical protein
MREYERRGSECVRSERVHRREPTATASASERHRLAVGSGRVSIRRRCLAHPGGQREVTYTAHSDDVAAQANRVASSSPPTDAAAGRRAGRRWSNDESAIRAWGSGKGGRFSLALTAPPYASQFGERETASVHACRRTQFDL